MISTDRTCLRCRAPLDVGYLLDRDRDIADVGYRHQSKWVEGVPETSFWTSLKLKDRSVLPVFADRCPQCGTIELRA
jgi:hypothetical protein